jgi:hypothetical protein
MDSNSDGSERTYTHANPHQHGYAANHVNASTARPHFNAR